MGFDPEQQKFTPSSFELMPVQFNTLLHELGVNEVEFVSADAIWFNRDGSPTGWVNGKTPVFRDNDIIALGETDPDLYVRIINTEDGLIADFSHMNKSSWRNTIDKFGRKRWPSTEIEEGKVQPLPLIHCIFNEGEKEICVPVLLSQYNIDLSNCEIQPLFDSIEGEDDDEDEEIETGEDRDEAGEE